MTLKEIVSAWLKEHEYDGLCSEDCGCRGDNLMWCEEPRLDCAAGHAHAKKEKKKGDTL
ncbi:MAG: hypothetical protein V2A79_10280 [Planctomycetota bacterium]